MNPLHLGLFQRQVAQVMPVHVLRGCQCILAHSQLARGILRSISVTGLNRATRLRGRKELSGQLNVRHAFKKTEGRQRYGP
jgi:hypothetical protein